MHRLRRARGRRGIGCGRGECFYHGGAPRRGRRADQIGSLALPASRRESAEIEHLLACGEPAARGLAEDQGYAGMSYELRKEVVRCGKHPGRSCLPGQWPSLDRAPFRTNPDWIRCIKDRSLSRPPLGREQEREQDQSEQTQRTPPGLLSYHRQARRNLPRALSRTITAPGPGIRRHSPGRSTTAIGSDPPRNRAFTPAASIPVQPGARTVQRSSNPHLRFACSTGV